MARTAADQRDTTSLAHIFEVDLADISMNKWEYPELALYQFIEVFNKVLVPHELGLPGLRIGFLASQRCDWHFGLDQVMDCLHSIADLTEDVLLQTVGQIICV